MEQRESARLVADKLRKREDITTAELAVLISQDIVPFMAFLIDNNPVAVNRVLKFELGKPVPFEPDRSQIIAQIDMLIQKRDINALKAIIKGFKLNPNAGNYTTDPEILAFLKENFTKK
jgi:hypothetical protein